MNLASHTVHTSRSTETRSTREVGLIVLDEQQEGQHQRPPREATGPGGQGRHG